MFSNRLLKLFRGTRENGISFLEAHGHASFGTRCKSAAPLFWTLDVHFYGEIRFLFPFVDSSMKIDANNRESDLKSNKPVSNIGSSLDILYILYYNI